MISILYDNKDPFTGISTEPLIEKNVLPIDYCDRWGITDSFILNGNITGKCNSTRQQTLDHFFSQIGKLINNFSGQYRPFLIKDDANVLFSGNAQVTDINVQGENFYGFLPYTLSLNCYRESCWSGIWGVVDPVNEYSFSQEGCNVSLNHRISARGFNTNGDNAYTNAKNYVGSNTGWNPNNVIPYFVSNAQSGFVLESRQESANRFEGTYEIVENYIYNTLNSNYSGAINYNLEYNKNLDDFGFVSIRGAIIGGLNNSMTHLRSKLKSFDFYGKANTFYKTFDTGNLKVEPQGLTFDENYNTNSIDFTFSYIDSQLSDPYIIDSLVFSENFEDGTKCLDSSYEFKSDIGCLATRLARASGHYTGTNISNLTQSYINKYNLGIPKSTIESMSYSVNPSEASISYSDKFCNNNCITGQLTGIQTLDYSMKWNYGLMQFSAQPSQTSSGNYSVKDLNFNKRQIFTVQGNGIINLCANNNVAMSELRQFLNILQQNYFSGTHKQLEGFSISYDNQNKFKDFSFTANWSCYNFDIYARNFST